MSELNLSNHKSIDILNWFEMTIIMLDRKLGSKKELLLDEDRYKQLKIEIIKRMDNKYE